MIQHRYGWSDEYILALPYLRFQEVLRIASDAAKAEAEARFIEAAFVGWQVYASRPRPSRKAPKPISFKKWLRKFRLDGGSTNPPTAESNKRDLSRAHANADKVRAAFKRR